MKRLIDSETVAKSLKSARENCKNQFYIESIFVDGENDSKILS